MAKTATSDGAVLRGAISSIVARLRREDEVGPIGSTAFGLLALLRRDGPMSASELADLAHVEPQSISRALATLEEADLIGRRVDDGDRRRAILSTSPLGSELVTKTMRKRNAWLNAAIAAHCNADEKATLRAAAGLLERLAWDGPEETAREAAPAEPRGEILNLVPFAAVADVRRSVDFYEPIGFEVDGMMERGGRWVYASLRGTKLKAARIMFSRASDPVVPKAQGVYFYAWTDNLRELHGRLTAAGYTPSAIDDPKYKLEDEFILIDPDGYQIKVGQMRR